MKYTIKVITISFVISLLIFGGFLFIKNLLEQESAYKEYLNEDHKYFCELAESREASEEYLKSRNCK